MTASKQQTVLKGFAIVLMAVGGVGVFEAALRTNGETAWDPRSRNFGERAPKVEPGGILFQRDARLGFASLPGTFTVTQGHRSFRATNLDRMHRAVLPPGATAPEGPRPGVWIFGDSTTYGWGVDDEQAYAGVLQQLHPELEIQNLAIGGYSTTQSLMELEESLATGATPPRVAVLAYASSHDGRNMMLRNNRKAWFGSEALSPDLPAAWLNGDRLEYRNVSMAYSPWPLMDRSALVNFIEGMYNKSQVLTHGANAVSRALIGRFAAICDEHRIAFVLVGAARESRTNAMLRWAAERGIDTVNIAVDMNIPENALSDMHPNAKSHAEMAERLEPVVLRNLTGRWSTAHAPVSPNDVRAPTPK